MMMPFKSEALRLQLTSEFGKLSYSMKDASKTAQILAALKQETSCILGNLAFQWNTRHNISRHLPDEVLAICFTFLPFKARLAASHVSRLWRSIILTTPAIWSFVDLSGSYKHRHELLRMALSRTGSRPVELHGWILSEPDPDGIVRQCLLEHLHHIRHIRWALPSDSLPLNSCAPLLETIDGVDYDLDLPSDFLGGIPQRLRMIYVSHIHLPQTCPALSTVTRLTLEGPGTLEEATKFGRLFDLFPALNYLFIHELQEEFSRFLPPGPPPPSLQKLELTTSDESYDLTRHYVDWRTDTLLSVSLELETLNLPLLGHLLTGSTSLDIQVQYGIGRTCISAFGPGNGRMRSVAFVDDDEDATCVPGMILRVLADSDLRSVRSVQIPISALASFLPVFAALPDLQHLGIFFKTFPEGVTLVPRPRLPWDALGDLARVKELCVALEEIDIEAVCWNSDGPLTVQDASELLVRLVALGDGVLSCAICIKGFPEEIVRHVKISHVAEFDIFFDVEQCS